MVFEGQKKSCGTLTTANWTTLLYDELPLIKNRADFYLTGHDHDLQYLVDKGCPHFIVSGATGHPRDSRMGPRSVYASHTIGFSYFHFTRDEAVVKFVDAQARKIFEKKVQAFCNTAP